MGGDPRREQADAGQAARAEDEPGHGPGGGVDLERANVARMYDYWLGGAQHFAVDRAHADRIAAANPATVATARGNRAFLARAVGWCLTRGIDQFLDLGSGVPTVGNVHEVAHTVRPGARVAYVDFEPVAVARAGELLADLDTATITRADLRDAASVLAAPGVAGLLDLTRPVALLAVAVLHYVPEPLDAVLAPYLAVLAPGSAVVITHVGDDQDDPELAARLRAGREAFRGSATEVTLRSRAELLAALPGLEIVPPGIVDATDWPRPDPGAAAIGFHTLVATVGTPIRP